MKKKYIFVGICLFISFSFIFLGMYWIGKGEEFFENLTIKAEDKFYDTEWIKSVMKEDDFEENDSENLENKFSFSAWTESKNESVSDVESGRREDANVISVYGQSRCLLPFGKNLDICDGQGCLIGMELAKDLFGSDRAEGQRLEWRGQLWIVRGVVKEPSKLVMVQMAKKLDELEINFNKISIMLTGNEDRKQVGEEFINLHGILAYSLRYDYMYSFSWLKELIPGEWADFESWKQNFKTYLQMKELAESSEISEIEAVGFKYKNRGRQFIFLGLCAGLMSVIGSCLLSKFGKKLDIRK